MDKRLEEVFAILDSDDSDANKLYKIKKVAIRSQQHSPLQAHRELPRPARCAAMGADQRAAKENGDISCVIVLSMVARERLCLYG